MSSPCNQIRYPARDPYFARRFTRLLIVSSVAAEIGPLGVWMLTVIVYQEAAVQYSHPALYWDQQLLPLLGVNSLMTFRKARSAAVDAGWLHFEPGSRARPGRYWVTIPQPIESQVRDDEDANVHQQAASDVDVDHVETPSDEPPSSESTSIEADSKPNRDLFEANFISNRERSGQE